MTRRKKRHKARKNNTGGEPKKKASTRFASQKSRAALADAHDRKRNNIGPSGQGSHRGRERANIQTNVSARPDVPSVGTKRDRAFKRRAG